MVEKIAAISRLMTRVDRPQEMTRPESLDTVKFAEIAVEGTQGQVPGFPSHLQHQAI